MLDERRREQEAERAQRNNNDISQNRGELDLETSPFMEIYEAEQENKRKLGTLEPISTDDFLIKENVPYAFSVLRDFFKNKSIPVEDEAEVLGADILALKPAKVEDNEDGLTVRYELTYEVEEKSFTEHVEIRLAVGESKEGRLTVSLSHLSGNRLYFKKIAKEIKNLFSYCRV